MTAYSNKYDSIFQFMRCHIPINMMPHSNKYDANIPINMIPYSNIYDMMPYPNKYDVIF